MQEFSGTPSEPELDMRSPRPQAANDAAGKVAGQSGHWDDADGEGPDRLFNRYRRLRLQALAENAA
jgi:hypothetical protein